MKLGFAPGFAIGIDDPARYDATWLEGDLLWCGLISLEHQLAAQMLALVKEGQKLVAFRV